MLTSVKDVIKDENQGRGKGVQIDPKAKPKKANFLARKATKVASVTSGSGKFAFAAPNGYKYAEDEAEDTTHLGSLPDAQPWVVHGYVSVLGLDHRRSNTGNEDAVQVVSGLLSTPMDMSMDSDEDWGRSPRKRQWNYYAVFDGHGGGACSSHTSRTLHTNISTMVGMHSSSSPERELGVETVTGCIERAFFDTEQSFCRWARESSDYSGSCALAVLTAETDVFVANCGDCAGILLLYEPDGVKPMRALSVNTRHTARNKAERARVAKAGGYFRDERVNGVLEPTRSFGDIDMKGRTATGVIATPEIKHFPLDTTKPWVMVLGTDGLWDYISIPELIASVPGPMKTREKADEIANLLMRKALAGGSGDDITVLVVSSMHAAD